MTTNTTNDRSTPFRMVALDLDGTLLQSNHQLADKQAEYLRTLYKSGFRICIATGRAAPSVYGIVKKLALPDPTPVVCSNGARGFLLSYKDTSTTGNHKKSQKELFYTPVSREAVIKTIQLAKKLGYFVQYYIDDGIYANPITESHCQMMKEYEILTDSCIETVDDDFDRFLGAQDDDKLPSKLLVRCEKEEFATCHPSFVELLNSTSDDDKLAHIVAAFNKDLDWFLEILHPDVNKGHGLRNMCQKLEIPMNDVIAIGDGTNDIEFLQMSGLGIAMNNAHESLRKVASYTMEWTNDEHGVIKTLEALKMKGKLCFNN
jgi:Cof subfamily protein (haloacid dehalogenase superfamily)